MKELVIVHQDTSRIVGRFGYNSEGRQAIKAAVTRLNKDGDHFYIAHNEITKQRNSMSKKVHTEQKDMYGKQVWYATLKTGNSGVGFYGDTEKAALDQLEEYLIARDPQILPERILNSFFFRDCERVNKGEPYDEWLMDGWNEYERILSLADAKDAIAIAELEHVIESGTPQPAYGEMMREVGGI